MGFLRPVQQYSAEACSPLPCPALPYAASPAHDLAAQRPHQLSRRLQSAGHRFAVSAGRAAHIASRKLRLRQEDSAAAG